MTREVFINELMSFRKFNGEVFTNENAEDIANGVDTLETIKYEDILNAVREVQNMAGNVE